MRPNFAIRIFELPAERLEAFVDEWISLKVKSYVQTERWSGPGDRGRDVVGYLTDRRHEGAWHNYQCKQLQSRLTTPNAILELGKIFMHAAAGEYSLPSHYVFVAPRGVVRGLNDLLSHPESFRQAVIDKWDSVCRDRLVESQAVPLTPAILENIRAFDFKEIEALDSAKLEKDEQIRPLLVRWFNDDPGPAPHGIVPDEIQPEESSYLRQLVDAYSERVGAPFVDTLAALGHDRWGDHLRNQRTRYFDAASFKRFYRDSTPEQYLITLDEDIYQGVVDVYGEDYKDALARVDRVMAQAAVVTPSGILGRHARVQVKQGICHHFANEGRLLWKR